MYVCPICNKECDFNPRYPKAVCSDCASNPTDELGNVISFRIDFNGFLMNEQVCFIRGVQCYAIESRFGGIVIQVKD